MTEKSISQAYWTGFNDGRANPAPVGAHSEFSLSLLQPLTDRPGSDHYKGNDIEPIDLIVANGDLDAFCRANIIKYVSRYERKGGSADLQKARIYLETLLHSVSNAERAACPV